MAFEFADFALVTSEEVEMWTGVDSTTLDPAAKSRIEFIVNTSSEAIQDFCGRSFQVETVTEIYDGQESDLIPLQNYPIISINSIHLKATPLPAEKMYVRKNEGVVLLKDGFRTPRGRGTVVVDYTFGYNPIPFAIKQACLYQYQFLYNTFGGGNTLGVTSRSKMGEAETKDKSIGENGLIAEVIGLIGRYRRMEAPNVSMFPQGS